MVTETTREDPMAGRSGHAMPEEYGNPKRYHMKALTICAPSAIIALVLGFTSQARVSAIITQVAVAYAFGSNLWLFRYGPRMLAVCKEHSEWLGREAHAIIQASNFPEFFALQSASCIIALGAHLGLAGFDSASYALLAAVACALLNLLWLGPVSNKHMFAMYSEKPPDEGGMREAFLVELKSMRRTFGMYHGMSMLFDFAALIACLAYMTLSK